MGADFLVLDPFFSFFFFTGVCTKSNQDLIWCVKKEIRGFLGTSLVLITMAP